MQLLMLKDLPRYECLIEAAKSFPELDPSACEAFLHLLRTGDEGFRLMHENLARHNLSQGRFTVLMLLWGKCRELPDLCSTPAELSDCAGVTRATMTGLIDTLERDGLVVRAPDPEDRRMMPVRLTPKGEAMLKQVLPAHFRLITALMTGLSVEERKTFVGLLGKVLAQVPVVKAAQLAAASAPGGDGAVSSPCL